MGLESLEVDEAGVQQVGTLNALVGSAQKIQQTLYAPVRFLSSESTWWGMVDSGAQVSIISSGLLEHLRLMETRDFKAYPSAFTVSGFTGGEKLNMPIVELWMRLGVRGEDERWQMVHLAVLNTAQYKFIIGMDILSPLGGQIHVAGAMPCLQLTIAGGSFRLPLKTKEYVMKSTVVTRYLAWARQTTVHEVDCGEEDFGEAALNMAVNHVGVEEAEYVGADLHPVLLAAAR